MSEVVRKKGCIKLLKREAGETLEEQCKQIILREVMDFKELPSYYDTYAEYLSIELGKKYYIRDDSVYSIELESFKDDYSFFEGNINENGDIDFHIMYYNGGCNLSEALDVVMKNIDKKQDK